MLMGCRSIGKFRPWATEAKSARPAEANNGGAWADLQLEQDPLSQYISLTLTLGFFHC
jgi:hypothetical protein